MMAKAVGNSYSLPPTAVAPLPDSTPGGVTIAQDFRPQRVLATESVVVTTFEGACAR